jgi:hypothetical protein
MATYYSGADWDLSSDTGFSISGYPLTLACWMRKSSNALRTALSIHSTSGFQRCYIGTNSSGYPILSVTSTSNAVQSAACTTLPAVDTWFHVVGVFKTEILRTVYLNGVAEASSIATRLLDVMNSTITGAAWTSGTNSGNRWVGEVAECCIYDRDLSVDEINALYLGGPDALSKTNLKYYDRMCHSTRLDQVGGTVFSFRGGSPTVVTEHPRTF